MVLLLGVSVSFTDARNIRGSGVYSPSALERTYEIDVDDISNTAGYADYIVVIDELQTAGFYHVMDALSGRVPGLINTPYGPRFRGGTGLLFVVDGMPVDSFAASAINPLDVATVEIHGSMSASIFGRRGINGAIVLNTK